MSNLASDADRVEKVSQARHSALEQIMLRLEPRTPDEVFSLALLLATELDTVLANYTDHDSNAKARAACDTVERAMRAVIDGLYRHVKLRSPLVGHYFNPDLREHEKRRGREIEALAEMTDREINALIARRERELGLAD